MGHQKPSFFARLASVIGAAAAAVAASIVVPSAAITAYAAAAGDAGQIAATAGLVAEPMALLGAMAATYGLARLIVRRHRGRDLVPWVAGGVAVGTLLTCGWVADFDWWTAASALLIPAAALAAARHTSSDTVRIATAGAAAIAPPREVPFVSVKGRAREPASP